MSWKLPCFLICELRPSTFHAMALPMKLYVPLVSSWQLKHEITRRGWGYFWVILTNYHQTLSTFRICAKKLPTLSKDRQNRRPGLFVISLKAVTAKKCTIIAKTLSVALERRSYGSNSNLSQNGAKSSQFFQNPWQINGTLTAFWKGNLKAPSEKNMGKETTLLVFPLNAKVTVEPKR